MPERIAWFYQRKGCKGSKLARAFLLARDSVIAEEVDAIANPIDKEAALEMLRAATKLVVAWRNDVCEYEVADGKIYKYRAFRPGKKSHGYDAPHGSPITESSGFWHIVVKKGVLRTPSIRKGGLLLVGFSDAAAKRVFRGA
jgi:arsenate reductase-like glutaredoxin family protein